MNVAEVIISVLNLRCLECRLIIMSGQNMEINLWQRPNVVVSSQI